MSALQMTFEFTNEARGHSLATAFGSAPVIALDDVRVDAPFGHPRFGEVWITRKTDTHVSFYAPIRARTYARIKLSIREFVTGMISHPQNVEVTRGADRKGDLKQ